MPNTLPNISLHYKMNMIYSYANVISEIWTLIAPFYCCLLDKIMSLREVWRNAQEKEKWFVKTASGW